MDFLIVGGGISGRLLQLELEHRGVSTLVYDNAKGNSSSIVAAGLANPLVGKFFTIGWRATEFFADLDGYYSEIENRLESSFFRPCAMNRIISSAGEQNIWLSKAHQGKYVGFCHFVDKTIEGIRSPFGMLEVQKGGELNTVNFLSACANKLSTVDDVFQISELNPSTKTYKDIHYDKIVFCEGIEVSDNPLFRDVIEVVPTKGELLEIETDLQPNGDIYLGGVFMQHLYDKRWRIGSTYQVNDRTLNPTEMMREDLTVKLERTLDLPYQVVNQVVGIRPASLDRKPILGEHPNIKDVYIVNGMGSKAVSLAPLLTKEMCDFMLNDTPLHTEIDINRF